MPLHSKMRKALSLLSLSLTSCITVPNVEVCSTAGLISDGAVCSATNTGQTSALTFDQFVNFLEASQSPAKAASVCMSASDFSRVKTALQQACKEAHCEFDLTPIAGMIK